MYLLACMCVHREGCMYVCVHVIACVHVYVCVLVCVHLVLRFVPIDWHYFTVSTALF